MSTVIADEQFRTLETIAERIGREHGKAAGSWAIDGNTSTDRARDIVRGYDDGDPAVMDMQPSPLSGEWSDGLSEADVITEICDAAAYLRPAPAPADVDEDTRESLLDSFETGYGEGYWDEVIRAAKAILPATVRDVLAAASYNPDTSYVVRTGTVRFSTSMLAHGNGSFTESRDVLIFTSAQINSNHDEDPLEIANYRALDAMPEWAELRSASPYSDATYFALEMDGDAPEDLVDVITGLEQYPCLDDELMSQAEMELAKQHWDSYGRSDARDALVKVVAAELDVDPADVDLDEVFADVDVDTLLDERVVSSGDRYPEYVDPSFFEFHVNDIAADVVADMRAWLTAEANRDQGELF